MALHYLAIASFSPSHCLAKPNLKLTKSRSGVPCRTSNMDGFVLSSVTSGNNDEKTSIARRSANYKPPLWDYDYIQSLQSHYVGESYEKRANELRGEVRMMIDQTMVDGPSHQLKLIDVLQRLGLSYHFECEIDEMLKNIYNDIDHFRKEKGNDLYVVALAFRLLRQHHFNIPQDIFSNFMNESGNFKESLSTGINQILCLYEATYFSVEDEQILKKARDFATKHLEEYLKNHEHNEDQNSDVEMVRHALELPLHWRMPRLETKWFIDVYEERQDHHHLLLELAKLDYNMVQAVHQQDLHHVSRWWKSTGIAENLSFARDRVMENFMWAMGTASEPQFVCCRRMAAKYNALITTLDDVYDVYGTLDELELFTDVVERWDLNSIEHLPQYMRVFFLALDNHVNEMASLPLNTQGIDITPYLKNAWAELCKVYMLEAKWYYKGYTPTLEEFIDNAWISIGAPVILVHAYFLTTDQVTREALDFLHPNKYHNIIRWSSTILRLADDMGTSSEEIKRGDVPKSIQCYMHETGASEEEARDYVRHLIDVTWEKMNRDRVADSPFSRDFIRIAMNYSRMAQCMYLHGDGHASQDEFTKNRVHSLLVQPFLL